MKNQPLFIRHWNYVILFAVCLLMPSLMRAQSIATCEVLTVDSTNNVTEQICITEGSSLVDAYVDVSTQNQAYLPSIDAYVGLSDVNGSNTSMDYYDGDLPYDFQTGPTPTDEASADVTTTYTPNDIYWVQGGYGECYDENGDYGVDPQGGSDIDCAWTDPSSPNVDLATNIFDPSYQVVSILYPAPGNQSTNGFGDFTTNGTTTSVGSSFQYAQNIAFTGGTPIAGGGASIGYSASTSDTTAYQTTLTNQSGMTEEANTKALYNSSDLNMPNHEWDTFEILLNPQITTASDDSNNIVGYAADIQPSNGSTVGPDYVPVVAIDMIMGTIPADTLNQQQLPAEGSSTVYVPGLASICKNLIVSEYNSNSCTTVDQCGCTVSDFSNILTMDPLLGWNSSNDTVSPMPGYESPLDADAAGKDAAGNPKCQTPSSSLDCRYVPVPATSGGSTPTQIPLAYATDSPVSQTDTTTTSQTLGAKQSINTSISDYVGFSGLGFNAKLTTTDTWTWTWSESAGSINSIGNTMNFNLQTSSSGCEEQNYVYEDTIFHTFVVQPPQSVPYCE